MSRKKVREEDLYEDEKIIPDEENNCFAFCEGRCTALSSTALTKKDRVNCGTLRCPFYKPKEHICSVRHLCDNGEVVFESRENYEYRTGKTYLSPGDEELYEKYPHKEWASVEEEYEEYMMNQKADFTEVSPDELLDLKKAELQTLAREKNLPFTMKMTKCELISLIEAA